MKLNYVSQNHAEHAVLQSNLGWQSKPVQLENLLTSSDYDNTDRNWIPS